jgi:hypothetical protein
LLFKLHYVTSSHLRSERGGSPPSSNLGFSYSRRPRLLPRLADEQTHIFDSDHISAKLPLVATGVSDLQVRYSLGLSRFLSGYSRSLMELGCCLDLALRPKFLVERHPIGCAREWPFGYINLVVIRRQPQQTLHCHPPNSFSQFLNVFQLLFQLAQCCFRCV